MQNSIDLSLITDSSHLKAMAYDQIANKEAAENNLRAINARLAQVLSIPPSGQLASDSPALPGQSVSDEDLGIEKAGPEQPDSVE